MATPVKKRDQSKMHTLVKKPGTKGLFRETPMSIVRESRRVKPSVAGRIAHGGKITLPARELFQQYGPEARGLGTRGVVRRRSWLKRKKAREK